MSQEYKDQDPLIIAQQAEQDLNSHAAKHGSGTGASDSTQESGINESVTQKFPGSTATATTGSATASSSNRPIPIEEGGDFQRGTGKMTKAGDFEGEGGPEDKAAVHAEERPGDDDVRGNIRMGGETRRP